MEKTPMATVQSVHRWKVVITPRKVAKTSTQLHGFEGCHMASLSLFVIVRHSRV